VLVEKTEVSKRKLSYLSKKKEDLKERKEINNHVWKI